MHLIEHFKLNRKTNDRILNVICLSPLLYLFWVYFFDQTQINVFETLLVVSGHFALVYYLFSYVASPGQRMAIKVAKKYQWHRGKRLSDWNFIITHRRTFGLNAFYFSSCHFAVYYYFELGLDWQELLYDLSHRHFITLGSVALAILAFLFVTSFQWSKKRLGYYWQYIHNLTNLIGLLLLFHIVLESKLLLWYHYFYLALYGALFVERSYQYCLGHNAKYFQRQRRRRLP